MAVRRLMKTLIIQMAIVPAVEELPAWLVASFWHVHTLMVSMAVRRSVLWCGACGVAHPVCRCVGHCVAWRRVFSLLVS